MKASAISLLLFGASLIANAAEPWTVERCMEYAAEHSHTVRQQRFDLDDSRVERTRAIGAFLPSIYGQTSGQMNFGRAINPETNTYTDVSTLYNGYGLQASLTIFDGLQRYNELRLARANVAMGRCGVEAERDDVRMKVYKAYMDLVYCEGAIEQTSRKRDESRALLHQTEVMAEVGQKSDADVAQMRATLAADDYELVHMQSQGVKAQLALKQLMNFPVADTLLVVTDIAWNDNEVQQDESPELIYSHAALCNPRVMQAKSGVDAARYNLRAARGMLLPTLSFSAGVSTSFYRNMDHGGHASFGSQFKNNAGEYLSLSLSIPIFNRLSTLSTIRSRRIALNRAIDNLAYQRSELQRIIVETAADVDNSRKEVEKMSEQVASDSIAAHLTTRKYEEGLASSIDVKTAAVTLLQSRVRLLQSRLTLMYNQWVMEYYRRQR